MPFYDIPSSVCPSCGDDTLLVDLNFCCKKCTNIYTISIDILKNRLFLSKSDVDKIKKEMIRIWELDQKHRKDLDKKIDKYHEIEDLSPVHEVRYQGSILEIIKSIKKDYGFNSLNEVLFFCLSTTDFILKAIRSMPGSRVYLQDNHGNKTSDVKTVIMKKQTKFMNEIQNRDIVNEFLTQMAVLFKMDDMERNKHPEE